MLLCDWAEFYSAAEQLAVRRVPRLLPPFAEVGVATVSVAMQDYQQSITSSRTCTINPSWAIHSPTRFFFFPLLSSSCFLRRYSVRLSSPLSPSSSSNSEWSRFLLRNTTTASNLSARRWEKGERGREMRCGTIFWSLPRLGVYMYCVCERQAWHTVMAQHGTLHRTHM